LKQALREKRRKAPVLRLELHKGLFPFVTGRRALRVVRLQVFVEPEERQPEGSHFRLWYHDWESGGEGDWDEHHQGRAFDCVVHREWPALYHGIVDVDMDVATWNRSGGDGRGILRFPQDLCGIRDVYVLCQFEARTLD
jgi:hypothetical protein